jgi:MFS family permease
MCSLLTVVTSFGKVYTLFPMKSVFMLGVAVFEVGSLLCTFATNSKMFIVGRAVAGLGVSAVGGGFLKLLKHLFPLHKQALMGSIVGGCQSVGLVSAPIIGGALIDSFTWRACFCINIPLGVICIALVAYGFEDPLPNPNVQMPFREKLKQMDLFGTLIAVPAITFLLLALQWGGTTYGWKNPIIIVLFVLAGCLVLAFGYVQYRQGETATLPLRIAKHRSMIAGVWYTACCNGVLAVTEYYISIYFQGVRGYTATKSGLLGLPMIVGFSVPSCRHGRHLARLLLSYAFLPFPYIVAATN